jgi:hypothetical protein
MIGYNMYKNSAVSETDKITQLKQKVHKSG